MSTDCAISTGQAWEEWSEEIEQEFKHFKIEEATDKKDAMIIYGEKELVRPEKSLRDLEQPEGECNQMDGYKKFKTKLNGCHLLKRSKCHAQYVFFKLKPQHGESS